MVGADRTTSGCPGASDRRERREPVVDDSIGPGYRDMRIPALPGNPAGITKCVLVRARPGQHKWVTDLSTLVGTEVRQIRLDYRVTLLLVDGPAWDERASGLLQIECPFRLENGVEAWTVTPSDKTTHAPVIRVLHLSLVSAEMDAEQTLRLGFSDGSTLTVERDTEYESWNLTGTGVPEVLVTPPASRNAESERTAGE